MRVSSVCPLQLPAAGGGNGERNSWPSFDLISQAVANSCGGRVSVVSWSLIVVAGVSCHRGSESGHALDGFAHFAFHMACNKDGRHERMLIGELARL